jgi:hypothetical protein
VGRLAARIVKRGAGATPLVFPCVFVYLTTSQDGRRLPRRASTKLTSRHTLLDMDLEIACASLDVHASQFSSKRIRRRVLPGRKEAGPKTGLCLCKRSYSVDKDTRAKVKGHAVFHRLKALIWTQLCC